MVWFDAGRRSLEGSPRAASGAGPAAETHAPTIEVTRSLSAEATPRTEPAAAAGGLQIDQLSVPLIYFTSTTASILKMVDFML